MPILHAIILGITQGLAEFIPISSSGHLLLVPWAFGWTDFANDPQLEKTFDVALHIGTFVGAFWYFRHDIIAMARGAMRSLWRRRIDEPIEKMAWLIVVATIPAALVGLLLEDIIVERLGAKWLIGVMLVVFGLVLLWADRRPGSRTDREFGWRDAALMGAAQALALQPGVSRSGATISMARGVLGFGRQSAARLSFLMSLPIIFGAGLFSLVDQLSGPGIPSDFVPAFVWGTVASGFTGFFAIWGTLRFLRTRSFRPFVVYRVIIGMSVIALAASPLR
ncbi:MAG TPA: undecaprenyl-diphosphate phosphatase [Acidimicrobiales bacterium]|nr:undecaprenyl-diphosphate phosphatase [Acidimicrobiales bacterium]